MITHIKKFFTIGVHQNQSFQEKRDIIFLNEACFSLLLISTSIFVGNILFGFYFRSLISLCTIPLFFSIALLQKKQKYFLAKVITIAIIIIGGFSSTFLFGAEAKTQYYIFASFCLSMILFKQRSQHFALFLIHLGTIVFLSVYLKYAPPIIGGQDAEILSCFHLPLILTCVFMMLSEYVLHNKRYEKRINDLMSSLEEHAGLLKIEKTKLKNQAEILQMTNDKILAEITARESMQQKLIESNKALEQFAYVASHDLKEPLRTICSFSQLLKRKLVNKLDTSSEEYFHFIIDGVSRMSRLLDDLLELSRLNGVHEMSKVDLNNCLELNILNLRNAIEKDKGKVIVPKLPTIFGNSSQMIQLFQNLISNGLKFKRETPPVVEIKVGEHEDHYLFSVKDNGIGIPEEFREKIFVIFQRLDKKTEYEGTGIGLSICKKIVQNHGGDIWVESTPGEGTTFFFTITKNNSRKKYLREKRQGSTLQLVAN